MPGAKIKDSTHPQADRFLRRSRLALALGFGGVLAIMLVTGGDALRVLNDFRRNDDRIRREFLFRDHVLSDIRSEVYVSGTYIRDYLLEPESARAESYRASLEQVRGQMETALESYGRQIAPEESTQYTALRAELNDYWGIWRRFFDGRRKSAVAWAMRSCAMRFFRAVRICSPSPTRSRPSMSSS